MSSTSESTEKLLIEGLQEMYYSEQQLVDALETLSEETSDETTKQAFSEHRDETQGHVERLEDVFEKLGEEPQTKEERVVKALIEEHDEFSSDNEGDILDRYNIAAGQKTEHYEIAAYGNLTSLAGKLGEDDVADMLEETLREEEEALDELSQAGEQFDQEKVESESE